MALNSRSKGKRGELELAHFLEERGFPARRAQQYSGTGGTGDLVCPALEWAHVECKRTEKLAINKAMAQAVRDCAGKVPLVAYRSNRTEWLAVVRFDDLLRMIKKAWAHGNWFEPPESSTHAPARDATP